MLRVLAAESLAHVIFFSFHVQLKVELSESHQEKEKLQQKVAFLEDEGHKHYLLKMQLLNEIQELTETVHKL